MKVIHFWIHFFKRKVSTLNPKLETRTPKPHPSDHKGRSSDRAQKLAEIAEIGTVYQNPTQK